MRRAVPTVLLLVAALAALAVGGPGRASAAVRLTRASGQVDGLAIAGSSAIALVNYDRGGPFALMRSSGSGRPVRIGGAGGGEFPMLASAPRGRVFAAWDAPISGGVRYAGMLPDGPPAVLAFGTGPGRLAVDDDGSALVAYPDETGDIAVTTVPGLVPADRASPLLGPLTTTLSTDAPFRRHFAAGLALHDGDPLVLDLVQRRGRSELRVTGEGAPKGLLTATGRLAQLEGSIAVRGDRIAVAYVRSGRPVLATAAPGGAWHRRTLPGHRVDGAPSVAFAGSRIVVAWAQDEDVLAATVAGSVTLRRLTRSVADDRDPYAVGTGAGRAYVAWTSRVGALRQPLLARLR